MCVRPRVVRAAAPEAEIHDAGLRPSSYYLLSNHYISADVETAIELPEMCLKSTGNWYCICWSMSLPSRRPKLLRCQPSLKLEARHGYDERQERETNRLSVMFVYIHRLVQDLLAWMCCWSR